MHNLKGLKGLMVNVRGLTHDGNLVSAAERYPGTFSHIETTLNPSVIQFKSISHEFVLNDLDFRTYLP